MVDNNFSLNSFKTFLKNFFNDLNDYIYLSIIAVISFFWSIWPILKNLINILRNLCLKKKKENELNNENFIISIPSAPIVPSSQPSATASTMPPPYTPPYKTDFIKSQPTSTPASIIALPPPSKPTSFMPPPPPPPCSTPASTMPQQAYNMSHPPCSTPASTIPQHAYNISHTAYTPASIKPPTIMKPAKRENFSNNKQNNSTKKVLFAEKGTKQNSNISCNCKNKCFKYCPCKTYGLRCKESCHKNNLNCTNY